MASFLSESSRPISSSFMHSFSSFAVSPAAFLNGLLQILPLQKEAVWSLSLVPVSATVRMGDKLFSLSLTD